MAKETKTVYCKCCLHAQLMRYSKHDPVLADCTKKPTGNEQMPFEREVASMPRHCAMHTYQAEAEKSIQKRVKVNRWTGHVFQDWSDEEVA